MSHEEQPYRSSTPSSHEGHHYVTSDVADVSRAAPYTPHRQDHLPDQGGLSNMSNYSSLTPFEAWTLRASKSQFNATAGALGGIASGIVTCPLDVIKTKLQAQGGFTPIQKQGGHVGHPKLYNGLVGTATTIWRSEGIRGMYRGLGPIVMGYLPTWAVWFTVYNKSKDYLTEHYKYPFFVNMASSIIAGASSTIATNPIWVIKTRLMSQGVSHQKGVHYDLFPKSSSTPTSRPTLQVPWQYRSTLDAARKMYTSEGILSFYSGLTPALLGLTHVAVQFPVYEFLKMKFTGQGMGSIEGEKGEKTWSQVLGVLCATVLSKVLASSATYPHEVIRTRLQTQRRPVAGEAYLQGLNITPGGDPLPLQKQELKYKGVIKTFRTILREEGWRAFYAGMGTNMMRAVPAAVVTMCTYELCMNSFKQTRQVAQGKASSGSDDGLRFA
ncbi:hypothetical protein jhhlp_006354 [Lomentospora prolificans]|uniref:Mitochondrial carrier protein n=1 Tax=Lomentospora prolificans TaxID=41688 RepID=A0A2N3N5P3_9PEZI|nr:hypothetical protein jhhlp_006354 [Lomentospora prolificans]